VPFWESVSSIYGTNDLVMYELYSEPLVNTRIHDYRLYMSTMASVVRKNSQSPLIIGGRTNNSYDTDSFIDLVANGGAMKDYDNLIWNYHPFQGLTWSVDKTPVIFEDYVNRVQINTKFPVIMTEFGQYCCATNGDCYDYIGKYENKSMGYNEALLTIAAKLNISWTAWAWRPYATTFNDSTC